MMRLQLEWNGLVVGKIRMPQIADGNPFPMRATVDACNSARNTVIRRHW